MIGFPNLQEDPQAVSTLGKQVGKPETIHMSEKSAFRRCGRDLVEFFNNTGWAFTGKWPCLGAGTPRKIYTCRLWGVISHMPVSCP